MQTAVENTGGWSIFFHTQFLLVLIMPGFMNFGIIQPSIFINPESRIRRKNIKVFPGLEIIKAQRTERKQNKNSTETECLTYKQRKKEEEGDCY